MESAPLSHPRGWLIHIHTSKACSTMLSRRGSGHTLPSAAASEAQDPLSSLRPVLPSATGGKRRQKMGVSCSQAPKAEITCTVANYVSSTVLSRQMQELLYHSQDPSASFPACNRWCGMWVEGWGRHPSLTPILPQDRGEVVPALSHSCSQS